MPECLSLEEQGFFSKKSLARRTDIGYLSQVSTLFEEV
jgi:hypothetical protein